MAQGSFSGQISEWVKETKERRDAVYKGSAQRIVEIMQTPRAAGGNLRVRDGFLRASLFATTSDALPPQTTKPAEGVPYTYDAMAVNLVISSADVSERLTFVYTANYARHREYKGGDRWVALAAQRWPQVVEQECAEARTRALS